MNPMRPNLHVGNVLVSSDAFTAWPKRRQPSALALDRLITHWSFADKDEVRP